MNDYSLRVSDLSKATNLPETTIRYIIQGLTDNPRLETLVALAEYFRLSIDQLVGLVAENAGKVSGESNNPPSVYQGGEQCQPIPVLEWDEIKSWKQYKVGFEGGREFVMCAGKTDRDYFALRVKYEGRGVFPRDSLIVIDPEHSYRVDNYVVVSIRKNRPTIRQVWEEGGILYLNAVGGNVPSEEIQEEHMIFGTVVECRIPFK